MNNFQKNEKKKEKKKISLPHLSIKSYGKNPAWKWNVSYFYALR